MPENLLQMQILGHGEGRYCERRLQISAGMIFVTLGQLGSDSRERRRMSYND